MPQQANSSKPFISAIMAGLLVCSLHATAIAALNDPDNPTSPVVDTTPPSAISINKPIGFDPNRYDKDDGANRPIVSPDFKTQIAETVEVADENTITFSPTGNVGPLLPGTHIINWTATDLGFNSRTAEQTLEVLPALNLGLDQVVAEGGTAVVTAYLSGTAPDASYPITVPYTVSGTASIADHSAVDSSFVFNAGVTQTSFSFPINIDGISDAGETVVITLGAIPANAAFAGHKTTHTITITETNQAPLAQLFAMQASEQTRVISTDAGTVTLSAEAYDANGDTILYDWSASDNALVPTSGTNGSSFTFEAQDLNPGFYTIRLSVSDAGGLSSTYDLLLVLPQSQPQLTDSRDSDDDNTDDLSEGIYDNDNDGIPNYLDALSTPTLIQAFEPYVFDASLKQSDTLVTDNIELKWEITTTASNLIVYPLLISTEPGLHINLGPTTFASANNYARISSSTAEQLRGIPLSDNIVSTDGQVLDIEITHLPQAGSNARIIIPQAAPLPASQNGTTPEFVIFSSQDSWDTFSTDSNNHIATDVKDDGDMIVEEEDSYCSGFDEVASYTSTLGTGDECLLITIQDGGPNDYDGVANGNIRLMGGVFITSASGSTSSQTNGETFSGNNDTSTETLNRLDLGTGSGGGSLGLTSLLCLMTLLLFRRRNTSAQ